MKFKYTQKNIQNMQDQEICMAIVDFTSILVPLNILGLCNAGHPLKE